MNDLLASDAFKLFGIIAVGKILERFRIGNFSLGIASVFIIAAIAGSQGIAISRSLQTVGLCIFIYAIGIEAGPQFFSSLKAKGASWIAVPLLFLLTAVFVYLAAAVTLQKFIPPLSFVGLFAGAFTCTPALASVSERIGDVAAVHVAFGLIYPLTLAGNVYLIPWLPRLFRNDIENLKRIFDEETKRLYGPRDLHLFLVSNPAIFGRTVGDLRGFEIEGIVFTRYMENNQTCLARDNVVLRQNGVLAAVGTREGLERVEMLVGKRELTEIPVPRDLQVKQFVVSNTETAGKTISKLLMKHPLDVRFTRIVRSGIELCPDSDRQILLGDRITAIGEAEDIAELLSLLGDDVEQIFRARFAPISIGIALGFLMGLVPLPFLKSPMGVTVGILLVAMLLGRKVRFASILWQLPQATTDFLKQFGLAVFFAVVGTDIGPKLSTAMHEPYAWLLFAVAIVLAFAPTIIVYGTATRVMKKNPLDVLGLLAGTVNNSSALVAINERWKTVIPNTAFAFAYPLSLILVIMLTQILAHLIGA